MVLSKDLRKVSSRKQLAQEIHSEKGNEKNQLPYCFIDQTERKARQRKMEKYTDWSQLGKEGYQIKQRLGLLIKIERETKDYFSIEFNKEKGTFSKVEIHKKVSTKFIKKTSTALDEIEEKLGKPLEIDSAIRKYLETLENPKRENESSYIRLRKRKYIIEERKALKKLEEGLELISEMQKEVEALLNSPSADSRLFWIDWEDKKETTELEAKESSGRSQLMSFQNN